MRIEKIKFIKLNIRRETKAQSESAIALPPISRGIQKKKEILVHKLKV